MHLGPPGSGPAGLSALDPPARRRRARRVLAGRVASHMRDAEPVRDTDTYGRVAELMLSRRTDAVPVVGRWDRLLGVVRSATLIRELGPDGPPDPHAEGAPAEPAAQVAGGYRHIACCVDESAAALTALRFAASWCRLGRGALSAVHATQEAGGQSLAAAQRLVADAAREVGGDGALVFGDPPVAAAQWAREHGVDLMVVAPHRGGLERAVLGSFARRLARRAPCPLLVVRGLPAARGKL